MDRDLRIRGCLTGAYAYPFAGKNEPVIRQIARMLSTLLSLPIFLNSYELFTVRGKYYVQMLGFNRFTCIYPARRPTRGGYPGIKLIYQGY
ncbi:hypothetical protein BFI45_18305 (plasmid) [Yersinia pestis subsp. microtus bv. Altaica]|uniref:Uncharacterized protein n=5 Tax=Yersinia pestis TaxID=632 RepID=A0A2U2H1Z4_YERPE|nr:unknown [Yersinia pestis KIM10+]AAS58687.1 hypothetical protein YP_pMT053 [Yersinia pestis biovar Microtus str. 91001]ADW01139.1 hypothetical protein YPC_4811 [Yersinia pestis biovar Medievalis str. Harbin 35]AYW81512.1 hypothetical protein EGX42_00085 [Yersinia pestis]EEO74263.1 hypothetical protein YP516_4683 [Yersinia pestis Nepal516]EEO78759.1 hypothetical protein YPF_4846 [Yersinia pestis biovar Orientalis str. India 195]EEO83362.1 hypothetical protein YPH_4764 [Yersinia pestis biovar